MWQEGGEGPCDLAADPKGDEIQKLSAIQTLPSLLAGDTQLCITRVIPKMQQTLHTASTEFHMAASSTFKSILEQKLVNHVTFAQTFLQSILHSLDSRDPVVAHAWLETLLDVIELLPIDVIRQEILPLAVSRGQLSQPVNSRISCCKLMGKICTRFDAVLIKNEVLPTVHSLCQDVNSEVRACICLQLRYVAEGIGAESVKPALLPSLVELASDEESMVRHASVQTIVHLLPQFQQDTVKGTIAPLVKKLCEGALKSDDDVVCVIAQEFGKLALGLQSSLTASEETWLLKYYQQLAQMGIQVAKKDNTKQDFPYMSNNPLVNGRYVECRRQCAFNIPAMFLFVSTAMGDLTALLPTFSELVVDPYYMVRRTIACGIHEVAKVFGSRCALLQAELIKLLKDNSEEVLQGLVPYLGRTLELLAQNQTIGTDNLDASGAELGKALLKCEAEISSGNNWRLSVQMFQQLETLPTCFPSDFIYTYFVPVALNRALNARPIPVRLSAGRCLLVFLRHNLKSTQRIELHSKIYTEFARNRNSYVRLLFLRIMIEAMAIFSSVYFKEHFYATVLRLTEDPIANVRLKVVTILPVMKSMLRLPTDKKLLSQLEGNVRSLLNNEKDRDVIFLLTGVIQKLDSIEVRLEGQTNPPKLTKQENEDLKKYEEERRLAGMASGKTPAYSTQMQVNPNLGKKLQSVQSKIGQGSRMNVTGEVLGPKGVRTPLDSSSKTSVQQSTTKSRQAGAMGLGMSDTSNKQGSRQSSSTSLRPMADVLKASTSSNNLTSSWARLTSNSMLLTHPWERIGRSEPNISLNSASPSEGHDCMSQRPRCDCRELAERILQTRLASDPCERGEYRASEPHCSCADTNYSEAGGNASSSSSREDDAHYPSTSDFAESLLLTQLREDRHEFLQNVLLTRERLSSKDKAPDLAALRALTNAAHYNSCWAFSSMPEIPVSLLDDEFLVDAGIRIPAQLSSSQSTSKIPNLQDIICRNRREGSAERTRRNSSGVAVGIEKGKTKRHSVEYEDCAKSSRMTSGVDRAKDNRGSGDHEDGSRSRLGRGKSEEPQFAAREESRAKRYSGSCQGRARFGYEGNQGKAEDKSKRNSLILEKDKATKPPQSKSVIDRSKRHSVNYTSRFLEARDAKQQKMKRHSVEVTDYTPVERNSRLAKRYSTLDVNHNQGSSKIPLRSCLASGSRTAPTTRASSPVRSGARSSYSRDSREDVRGSPRERFLGRFSSSDEEVEKICQKFLHCQTTPCSRAASPRSRDSKLPVRLQRKKL